MANQQMIQDLNNGDIQEDFTGLEPVADDEEREE